MRKSFEYVPLMRLGVPTSDGRMLSGAGVWHLASPCPLLGKGAEEHWFAMGTVHGMNFSGSSGMVYASGEAEPEIVAGLLLREFVLVPDFAAHRRHVILRETDDGPQRMWMEGLIQAVYVKGKEQWPWTM